MRVTVREYSNEATSRFIKTNGAEILLDVALCVAIQDDEDVVGKAVDQVWEDIQTVENHFIRESANVELDLVNVEEVSRWAHKINQAGRAVDSL